MIFSVVSPKGGVGKSTISQNLAVAFALDGHRACIIDADRHNEGSTDWYSARPSEMEPFVAVTPSHDNKAILKDIPERSKDYDVVIVDCPPVSEAITTAAMGLADMIIVPLNPNSGADQKSITDFINHIQLIRAKYGYVPAYIVVNMSKGAKLNEHIIASIREDSSQFDIAVLNSEIKHRVAYGEANYQGLSVLEWTDPKASGEMKQLYQEILGIAQKIEFAEAS